MISNYLHISVVTYHVTRSKLKLTILHYRYRTGQKHDMEEVTSYRDLRRRECVCVCVCVCDHMCPYV